MCWPSRINGHKTMLEFARLIAADFRVIVLDPPGLGSNTEIGFCATMSEHVHLALTVLDHLNIRQVHWVGHITAGIAGAMLYRHAPQRITSITLSGTPLLREGRFTLSYLISLRLLLRYPLGRKIIAHRLVENLGYASKSEYERIAAATSKTIETIPREILQNLRLLDGKLVRQIYQGLHQQHPPMLVIAGKYDKAVLARDQHTVAETTNSQYVELSCGHMTFFIKPERCAEAFDSFVKRQNKHLENQAQPQLAMPPKIRA